MKFLQVKQQFERTTELLDFCNDEIEEVKQFRTKWAISHFLKNVLPYIIWLIMLLIVGFGQGTKGKGDAYWFNQSLNQQFVESSGFNDIQSIDMFWVCTERESLYGEFVYFNGKIIFFEVNLSQFFYPRNIFFFFPFWG